MGKRETSRAAIRSSFSGIFLLLLLVLSSCDKNTVLEQNRQIADYSWNYADTKTFEADIADTALTYDLYINIRHSFSFEWRNVWVTIETVFPDGHRFTKRVNLLLSEPDGHWFGKCLGDNCDLQLPLQENAYFPQPGKYTFRITQDMRVNPLPHVKSIGLRIAKHQAR